MSVKTSGGRHGQAGYYALADLPQRPPVAECSMGSGWPEFDQIFKLYPGQFTVVTGKAGSGKSTFILNLVVNYARLHGLKTFMHVPENESRVELKLRSIWGDVPGFEKFVTEQNFIQSSAPEHYGDEPKDIKWILDSAIVAVDRDKCDLLVIDPWNELERSRPRDWLMTDYVNECLRYLKQFTRCMNVAIMVVVHPTKEGLKNGNVPSLTDCEGSLAWSNKADNGLIVVRDTSGTASRVISAKVRESPDAGELGVCHFTVDRWSGLFTPQYGATEIV